MIYRKENYPWFFFPGSFFPMASFYPRPAVPVASMLSWPSLRGGGMAGAIDICAPPPDGVA